MVLHLLASLLPRTHFLRLSPIHDGTSSIWHLSAVLNWFIDCKQKEFEAMLVEISIANMQLNIAKEYSYANPHIQAELTSVIIQN